MPVGPAPTPRMVLSLDSRSLELLERLVNALEGVVHEIYRHNPGPYCIDCMRPMDYNRDDGYHCPLCLNEKEEE
jgi:hypothetical protein